MADSNKEASKAKTKKSPRKKPENAISPVNPSVTVSTTTTVQPSSASISQFTETEQKRLQEMVLLANLEFAKLKSKIVKEKRKEIDALDDQIKEFLGPYMLIGYDLNDNPVEIVSASTAAENDALLERFRRVMFKINQNIANSNGEDPYGKNS